MNQRTLIITVLVAIGLIVVVALKSSSASAEKPTSTPESRSAATLSAQTTGSAQPTTDLVVLTTPQANTPVSSPLKIAGKAKGPWYFEATFPVRLLDDSGKVIAEGHATAQGEWTTPNFVPFTAELKFTQPEKPEKATLVLEKSNPSGLPENASELRIPLILRSASGKDK